MRTERFHCLLCGTECDASEIVYELTRAGFWARLWDALTSHGTARCPQCYSTMLRRALPVVVAAEPRLEPLAVLDELDDDNWWKAIK